jgi:hypothetical protein
MENKEKQIDKPEATKKAILQTIKFDECLERNAGFFSHLFFTWTHKLMAKGAMLKTIENRYIQSIIFLIKNSKRSF